MHEWWVTRTNHTYAVSLWHEVGGSSDWTPGFELVGTVTVQAPAMDARTAREILRNAGLDPKGCKVRWKSLASVVYGVTGEQFMACAVPVNRTRGGHVTPVKE